MQIKAKIQMRKKMIKNSINEIGNICNLPLISCII